MQALSYFALNKHITNTVTVPELHSIRIFAGDGVFHFIGAVNENLANLRTTFR